MHYACYKTILSPMNHMNCYRGCTHGCIYCDSRSDCYQMNHDFEDIEVKKDVLEILESQLRKKRKPCMISTGSMSDPYIKLERDLEITRGCIKLVERYGFGIAIQTKSDLILRDLDLLKQINTQTKTVFQTTLTTYDESLCKIVEPHVASTYERFRVLQTMHDEGIPTVVWLSPFLPFINDHEDNLRGLLSYCIRANVYAVIFFGFGLTLRAGNREYFYERLDQHFPGLKVKYQQKFKNDYVCYSQANHQLTEILHNTCREHGIICNNDIAFSFLRTFERKERQISMF